MSVLKLKNGTKCGWSVTASPGTRTKRRAFCFTLTQENTGVIVVKTHMYLLVATYTEGMYPSVCVEATEKLGKFVSPCLSSFPMVVRSSDCQ